MYAETVFFDSKICNMRLESGGVVMRCELLSYVQVSIQIYKVYESCQSISGYHVRVVPNANRVLRALHPLTSTVS
jgi:hypothetical protein